MNPNRLELVLSFSDLWKAVLASKKKILVIALVFGALCLLKTSTKPLRYTAKGVFKEAAANSSPFAFSPFEFLKNTGSFSGSSSTDALELISSLPLLERVVKRLNLQAHLSTGKRRSRITRFFSSLKAEWMSLYYRHFHRPSSAIVSKKQKVVDKLPFTKHPSPLAIKDLVYDKEVFTTVFLQFQSPTHYSVLDKKKKVVGHGIVGEPFISPIGSWTVTLLDPSVRLKKRTPLTLIPLRDAAQGVKKQLQAKRDTLASSLIDLSYTHPNRHLGAAIINAVMEEYREFIRAEAISKADTQIQFLRKQLAETENTLAQTIAEQTGFFEQNVEGGQFFSLEQEMNFLSESQAKNRQELALLQSKIDQLSKVAAPQEPSTIESGKFIGITTTVAQNLLVESNQKLEDLKLQLRQHQSLRKNLENPSFELLSLSQSLADPALTAVFNEIRTHRLELENTAHFTTKELESKQRELELTKNFLASHIDQLISVEQEKHQLLQEKIRALQLTLWSLLTEERDQAKQELALLTKQMTTLPKRWQAEQKIAYSTEFSSKVVETLANMIESKNVALNLEYVDSGPLSYATAPTLPDPPKIVLFTLAGTFAGASLMLFFLACKALFHGPSASVSNLRSAGLFVLGALSLEKRTKPTKADMTLWRQTASLLTKEKNPLIICSTLGSTTRFAPLLHLFSLQKKRVLCIDFTTKGESLYEALERGISSLSIQSKATIDTLHAKASCWEKEELLKTDAFLTLLRQLKTQYDLIIIQIQSKPNVTLFEPFAVQKLHIVTTEKLNDLTYPDAHFIIQDLPDKKEFSSTWTYLNKQKLSLKKLEPKLSALLKKVTTQVNNKFK